MWGKSLVSESPCLFSAGGSKCKIIIVFYHETKRYYKVTQHKTINSANHKQVLYKVHRKNCMFVLFILVKMF